MNFGDRLLFFLLFSGPPKFRVRDPNASLDAIFDWVVILHIVVWGLAAVWIIKKLWLSKVKIEFRLSWPEKLGILLACSLSVSIFVSEGQALTGFKVYQLLVTILFASLFVRLYGVKASLNDLFVANAILCAADVVAAFVAPSLVFVESEFGALRFRGDLIAQTGFVAVFGMVLLLTSDLPRSKSSTAGYIVLFGGVLLLSLLRTAYLAFFAFLLFALWKAPEIKLLKRMTHWAVVVIPIAVLGGALAQLEEYRPAESLWTLSDRLGLWAYLVNEMWTRAPWFGLGYFSASRIYGPEYNSGLGTAHSVFVEVLSGGGIVSFAILILMSSVLVAYGLRLLLYRDITPTSFAVLGLLLVTFFFVLIGSELESDPAGFTLWVLVAAVPMLCSQTAKNLVTIRPSTREVSILPQSAG